MLSVSHSQRAGSLSQEVRTLTVPRLSPPSLSKQTNGSPWDALTWCRPNVSTAGWTQKHEHLTYICSTAQQYLLASETADWSSSLGTTDHSSVFFKSAAKSWVFVRSSEGEPVWTRVKFFFFFKKSFKAYTFFFVIQKRIKRTQVSF